MGRQRDESDEELWKRVARSAKPLATGRPASHADRLKKEPQRETAKGEARAPRLAPKVAQGRGHRHVLVITGRGTEPDARRSFYEADERGVLRQAVPHWLEQPDLAPLVVSYAEAPRRLGGGGALYVRLRAAKRR